VLHVIYYTMCYLPTISTLVSKNSWFQLGIIRSKLGLVFKIGTETEIKICFFEKLDRPNQILNSTYVGELKLELEP